MPAQNQGTVTGDLRLHEIQSEHLGGARTIAVWLPPGYTRDDFTRYPVFYMHDGQNLFDRATAFGEEWGVDETATSLIWRDEIDPVIVVGIYNAGDDRIDEYTPAVDAKHERGGEVASHARFVVEELKPFIDTTYRTLPSMASTALGGSSLGGLATVWTGLRYPQVFGKLAAMSPSVWWADRAILKTVNDLSSKPAMRIWIDAGTAESESVIPDARALRDALVSRGFVAGQDLSYMEAQGAGHDERAWGARVGPMLRFMFPAPKRPPIERTVRAIRRLRDRWRGYR